MKAIIFAHPNFMNSKSMPLFVQFIKDAIDESEVWQPIPIFFRLALFKSWRKWLGYIDQYVVFPLVVYFKLKGISRDTLFVFADQALGPWVPLVKNRPHVIHCHDFMALRSALGLISENRVSYTGTIYQKYIRWGYSQGKNFISVSEKTRSDLHEYSNINANISCVVLNGLNYDYKPMSICERVRVLNASGIDLPESGYILHVGGAQWYKNRVGILRIYSQYLLSAGNDASSLFMVGPPPDQDMRNILENLPSNGSVKFFSNLSSLCLNALYSHTKLFLFLSLDEGYGWPIVEAQASAALVLTTNTAPMTEVGGDGAFYHPRMPSSNYEQWVNEGASLVHKILSLSNDDAERMRLAGLSNSGKFVMSNVLKNYRSIYDRILKSETECA